MNERIFYSEYFYQKGSKETDVLEKNAKEYPFSSLAAFMLLYHYKKIAHPGFETLARKTAVLFNNPHWLQFQLYNEFSSNTTQGIINGENFGKEKEIPSEIENELPLEISPEQDLILDSNEIKENIFVPLQSHEIIAETTPEENTQQENQIQNSFEENAISNAVQHQEFIANKNEENEYRSHEIITEINPEENTQHEKEIKESSEETPLSNSFQHEEFIENENAANESHQIQEIIKDSNELTPEIISENPVDENIQHENEISENFEETEINDFSKQQESFSSENAEKEDEIVAFEPLHTVDYFASQGIKINEELLTNDKLGSQMKSFTAWLKSMKKLHSGKLEEQSLATEKLIQTSADESNINTEVLTEAMAEVLIKQDKKEKAIEMFSKLSLINPSKSAYFAARIESIKSN